MTVFEFGKQNRDTVLLLHSAISGSQMEILPGLRHGDFSINNPERYVCILKEWDASK